MRKKIELEDIIGIVKTDEPTNSVELKKEVYTDTENKRFEIKDSILKEGNVIIDNEKEYTFPVLDSTLNFMFCKALNELHEENEHIKHTIKTMIDTERTELGRSVLRQLWEAIQ